MINIAAQQTDKNPNNLDVTKTNRIYEYDVFDNDPTHTRRYILENGLTVLLTVNKAEPRVMAMTAVKAGSKNDPATHTGLAHYLEHMLFKGTDKYGSKNFALEEPLLAQIEHLYELYGHEKDETQRQIIYSKIDSISGMAAQYAIPNEIDKMFSSIGAKGTNAFTSFDHTVYINDIPANQLENFLNIEAERYRNPQMRLFHTELEAVYEEKNISLDNDQRKITEAMMASLFYNHNYGKQTTIGTIDHLKRPSIVEIKKFFHDYYVPNNMALILAGDFDPDQVITWIDEKFSYMQPKEVAQYQYTLEPKRKKHNQNIYGPTAESVTIAWRFPGANDKNILIAEMLSNIIYNGKAGLLDLELNKKQEVLEATAGRWTMSDYGVMILAADPKEGQTLLECEALLLDIINKIKAGNFDEKMMQSIINNLKVAELRSLESNRSRASMLQNTFTMDIDWQQYITRLERMKMISKNDIITFANTYFTDEYVVIYKNKGDDINIKKIAKPKITPVTMNRNDQSDFVKSILNNTVEPLQPLFLDYHKDIVKKPINNGRELWYVENKENKLFTQYYVFDIGSYHNKLWSVALELLKYLPTQTMSNENISTRIYDLAASFNVSTSGDQMFVSIAGLNDHYLEIKQLVEDIIQNCIADQKILDELIERMIKERNDAKSNKSKIHALQLSYARYGADNPDTYVLSDEQLNALTAQELVDMLHTLLLYPTTIYYYGPMTADGVVQAHSLLGGNNPLMKIPEPHVFYPTQHTQSIVYFTEYDMVQAEIGWVYNDVLYNMLMAPTAAVFNQYFGGNMSSVVFQTIRESKALAYASSAAYITPTKRTDPYTMVAYIGTQADKMPEAITAMNELLTALPYSVLSYNQSLDAMRNKFESERIKGMNIITSYASALKRGLTLDIRQHIYNRLPNIAFTEIASFHKEHIQGKSYSYTILGDHTKIDMQFLSRLGYVKELTLKELFGY